MTNVTMIAAVAAGGAIGAVLRYTTSLVVGTGVFGIAGPLATLLVNVFGSAMMGGLAGLVTVGVVLPESWRGFFAVGLLGALTTFSSFALDAGALWQKQGVLIASAYVLVSVTLSLLAFGATFWMVKHNGIWQ